MVLPSKQPNSDMAQERYPALTTELLSLGGSNEIDYTPYAEALASYAPDLVRMVLDDDLMQLS